MKKIILPLSFTLMAVSNLTAQSFQLVKDINTGANSSNPQELVDFGDHVIFKAKSPTTGTFELFKSDGTESGTVQVYHNFASEIDNSKLVRSGNYVYFITNNSLSIDLWKSDGTESGTVLVKDSIGLDEDAQLIDNNGILFFTQSREDAVDGTVHQLWKSDGTEQGTVLIKEWIGDNTFELGTSHNGIVYFSIETQTTNDLGIWASNGTLAGTEKIMGNAGPIRFHAVLNNHFYLVGGSGIVAKTNGTMAGTSYPGLSITNNSGLVVFNNKLYFGAVPPGSSQGAELYSATGTNSTHTLVKDINLGSNSSNPTAFVLASDGFYFYANDGVHGMELWKSDGTDTGTHLVKDIKPGTSNNVTYFEKKALLNDRLFFVANDDVSGAELWSTDGTEANTHLHQDINTSIADGCIDELKVINNQALFFAACNASIGTELWSSGILEINDFEGEKQSILIAPNPANQFVSIKSGLPILSYKIIDLNGRTVSEGKTASHIDIDTLESGSYLIQAVLSNGTIATQRLIKQ